MESKGMFIPGVPTTALQYPLAPPTPWQPQDCYVPPRRPRLSSSLAFEHLIPLCADPLELTCSVAIRCPSALSPVDEAGPGGDIGHHPLTVSLIAHSSHVLGELPRTHPGEETSDQLVSTWHLFPCLLSHYLTPISLTSHLQGRPGVGRSWRLELWPWWPVRRGLNTVSVLPAGPGERPRKPRRPPPSQHQRRSRWK